MPASHIITRIQNIENRIVEIQKVGAPPKSAQTPKTVESRPDGDTFSEILDEIMSSKTTDQLNLMGDSNTITPNSLLANRTDNLMEIYKASGVMPTSKPKPILGKEIDSTNPKTWDTIIEQTSKNMGIDPKLVHAVIQAESAYDPNAVSIAGAEGLMQLMPYTAERIGIQDSFDPKQNILGGITVLKEMLTRYDGDLIKSLAAYNAGPDAVDRANGIPNYKETQAYVPRVLNYYYNLRHN